MSEYMFIDLEFVLKFESIHFSWQTAMTQTPSLKTQRMQVNGMDCAGCAMKIEVNLQKLAGVAEVSVDVATERMIVTYDPQQVDEQAITDRVTSLGYTIHPAKPRSSIQDNHAFDQSEENGYHKYLDKINYILASESSKNFFNVID